MTDNFGSDLPDWLKNTGESDSGSSQPPPPDEPSLGDFDWDTFGEDDASGALPEPGFADQTDDLPDWVLNADADEPDFSAELEGDFMDFFSDAVDDPGTPETPSQLGLKRVEPTPSEPKIRKLGTQEIDPSQMTFDEWEQYQEEREYRETNQAQVQAEEEIPDWFRDNVDLGDAERGIDAILLGDVGEAPVQQQNATDDLTDSNYVPEWFLGLEEQNLEEAPEWARTSGSTGDLGSLTDSSMFALPAVEEPEPEPPTPMLADDQPDVDDWLTSAAQEQEDSLSELDDLMADAKILAANAPNTAALLSDVLDESPPSSPQPLEAEMAWLTSSDDDDEDLGSGSVSEMAWLTTTSDDKFDTMVQPDVTEDDWLGRAEVEDAIPDTEDFLAMVSSPESEASARDWTDELFDESPVSAQGDDDDLFAAILGEEEGFDADSVDWLGEVDDINFDDSGELLTPQSDGPAPVAPPEDVRRAINESGSVDQVLTDLLGTTAAPKGLVVDNQRRELAAVGTGDDIDVLFDDVDDDFLAALDSSDIYSQADDVPAPSEDLAPGWVEELRPDRQVKLGAGGIELDFEQQPVNVLPENIQSLRETSQAVSQVQAPERQRETGALSGVSGGLGILQLERTEEETILQSGINITPQQAQRIDLLSDVLAVGEIEDEEDEDQAASKPRRKVRRRTRLKLDRTAVAVVLLGALAGPFVTDALHVAEDPVVDEIPAQQAAVFAAVDDLQAGDRVLIAFEYGPTAAGELNPLVDAVLRDIFNQGAIPVTLSTNPLGGANSYFLVDTLASDGAFLDALERDSQLVDGQDYYAVGYLSGGPVGIRSITRSEAAGVLFFDANVDDDGTPLEVGKVEADDFALVLVVAETTEDLRNWAEQFDVDGLPMYALTTTAIEPIASAYVAENGRFNGYLAGYRDTYRYNEIRNTALNPATENDTDFPDPQLAQWHSVALGALASGGMILLGTLLNLLRGIGRRRR